MKIREEALKIEKIYNFFEAIKSDITSKHFDEALLRIKKVIDVKELMSNPAFRTLVYYYSAIINIYVNNFSSAEKFIKKGLLIANKASNEFMQKNLKALDDKLKEIKKDPRDLIEKLINLSKIDPKEAFKAGESIEKTELPDRVYSAEEIRQFYMPIATSKFGDPNEVIETLKKALQMTKGSHDPEIIAEKANILYYLGSALLTVEDFKKAEETLKEGIEICKQIGNNDLGQRIKRILNSISEYY
ncbi:MAG: tetratricopeptide repeat protein [Candidatus Helarchaeota archaeon]